MKITKLDINKLSPYEYNTKLHPQSQIDTIKKSISKFGFNDPIAVWGENVIVEGHGRLEAAKQLGLTEVPCIRLDHLTDDERKAYAIAHNSTTMNSGFDLELLEIEIAHINIDMYGLGIDEYLNQDTEQGMRNIEVESENFVEPNDVWQLGEHRVHCTDKIHGEYDLIITERLHDNLAAALKGGRSIYYITGGQDIASELGAFKGFILEQPLVWVRNAMRFTKKPYQSRMNLVLFGRKEGDDRVWNGSQEDVFEETNDIESDYKRLLRYLNSDVFDETEELPSQTLVEWIRNSSNLGDKVMCDNIVVCEQIGRVGYMFGDESGCSREIKRWEIFTGKKAVRV